MNERKTAEATVADLPFRRELLGIHIDTLTMAQAAELIAKRAASRQSACYVVKPYVEFFDQARHDQAVRKLLNAAWLSLPDGVSVQWASTYLLSSSRSWWRALGLASQIVLRPRAITKPVPERFGGATFAWRLLEEAAAKKLSVYLIGSPVNSDISATAKAITRRLPNVTIAGTWPGQLKGKRGEGLRRALRQGAIEQELVDDLTDKHPDIILVGISFPLQVELMAKLVPQLEHGVLIGEGGTFDYDSFGGVRRRAPRLMQRAGVEWLWRLALEPARWRRQLAIPRFMWAVYRIGRSADVDGRG